MDLGSVLEGCENGKKRRAGWKLDGEYKRQQLSGFSGKIDRRGSPGQVTFQSEVNIAAALQLSGFAVGFPTVLEE